MGVYYTVGGKQFKDLASLVAYYDVMLGGDVCIGCVMYHGVKVGEVDIARLSAEVARNIK